MVIHMEPRIQYAQTADGVSIAFGTLGEGAPFVHIPGVPWSHIQLEWQYHRGRVWFEGLARGRMLVRYDGRGSGLSDREVSDYSLEAWLLDLEAVVERLGLERFALWGSGLAGPTAIAYAARYPERVSHLLLWCSYVRGSDFWRSPRNQAFRAIRETDWDLFVEAMAELGLGRRGSDEEARTIAAFIRESVTWEAANAAMRAAEGVDVTELLPQVRSPTLVLHRRQVPAPEVGLSREVASRIPDARLALLEGSSVIPFLGDAEAVLAAINEFLGEGEAAAVGAETSAAGAVRTVLFTDMEGSTALTQRLGDARAREVLREHERIVREALRAHGGAEVKTMGDGFMASFSSPTGALECAVAMQRAFAVRNASLPAHPEPVEGRAEPQPSAHASTSSARADRSVDAEPIRVRIGINAGEPVAEEDDLFGVAVIRAARIAAIAQGGEILVANVVRELAEGKDFLFADKGDVALRGFDDPVRLFELRWRRER
ncbi:MAG: hypothetical protein A2W34_03495 [Chloroflexi bacterium RBG_16_64_32]|nr:MAG: hypothetical protein A2W34_03495 [Chloroflexi bacterium RBG_16_64_32]